MRSRKDKPYRDYSDDSWFTSLMNAVGNGGCCWSPVVGGLAMCVLVELVLRCVL